MYPVQQTLHPQMLVDAQTQQTTAHSFVFVIIYANPQYATEAKEWYTWGCIKKAVTPGIL